MVYLNGWLYKTKYDSVKKRDKEEKSFILRDKIEISSCNKKEKELTQLVARKKNRINFFEVMRFLMGESIYHNRMSTFHDNL